MRNVKLFIEPQSLAGEWVPVPKTGQTVAGMGRSLIYKLARTYEIRTALVLRPGNKRGLRMLHLPSLNEYVRRVAAAQHAELERAAAASTTTSTTTIAA